MGRLCRASPSTQYAVEFAAGDVPQNDGGVAAAGREGLAVGGEGHGGDRYVVAFECSF